MAESGGGWKKASKIAYKQDLPPPGGYGKIPYLKNLPVRGPSGYVIAGMAAVALYFGQRTLRKNLRVERLEKKEEREIEMIYLPLLEAERDRNILRDFKLNMESEALNLVATGREPDLVPGQDVWKVKRWREPFIAHQDPFWTAAVRFWYEEIWRRDVPGP